MRTIDLFAGCGGLSLGFQQAGFDIITAFDNWQASIDVYKNNFNHPINKVDLSTGIDYHLFKSLSPECIIGGPPCQDFSSAGKRDETLGRADLTLVFANIVENVLPKWFVMENVDRITKTQILPKAISQFKKQGYGLTSITLNASFCGVPQSRKRFFLIGELGGQDNQLDYYLNKNLAQTPMTLHDYFGKKLDVEYYYRHPRSYHRRGIFSIYEPSPTIRGVNRPIPKGYPKHENDPCDITENLRPLTTFERSLIQTFPENFNFVGKKTDLEQMIGNAVPVKLAYYVANAINEYRNDLKNKSVVNPQLQLQLPF